MKWNLSLCSLIKIICKLNTWDWYYLYYTKRWNCRKYLGLLMDREFEFHQQKELMAKKLDEKSYFWEEYHPSWNFRPN